MFYWNEGSNASNQGSLFLIDIDAKLGRVLTEFNNKAIYFNIPTFKLPLKGSTFYYLNESFTNHLSNVFGGINYMGTYIFNSKQKCELDDYSGFSIVSNPETLSDRIDFKVKLIAENDSNPTGYLNIPRVYKANKDGVNSYGCINASSVLFAFYLCHDAWLLTPSGETIKIQEYVEPQTSTYSLRSSNKSYRVSLIESYIEEEKSKENPDEEKIKALTIIRDRYAEEDALKK